jgi:YidC/Oxa1 family membrane protein insertase
MVIGMLAAMAILMGWQWFTNAYLYKQHPEWRPQPPAERVTATQPSTKATLATAQAAPREMAPASTSAVEAAATPPATDRRAVPSATSAAPTPLGGTDAFAMTVWTDPRGAAISGVELSRLRAPNPASPYRFQDAAEAGGNEPLATRSLTIGGASVDLSVPWRIESQDQKSITYATDVTGPSGLVARVRKTIELSDLKSPGAGYNLQIRQDVENLGHEPIVAELSINGPTVPPRESERGPDCRILAGYTGLNDIVAVQHMVESFQKADTVRQLLHNSDGQPIAWVGTASVYFNAILRPVPADAQKPVADSYREVKAEALTTDGDASSRPILITLQTAPQTIQPGGRLSFADELFLGPKQRSLLGLPYYADPPRSYDTTLVITSGICAACTWDWLIRILVQILAAFHVVLRDWGLAIIGLVVLVRAILHPITKRSQVSMLKMQKLGPEMERLRKKFGDDKEGYSKAAWELQKTQGFTPVLGCLPMFLQMPIWIALWQALQTTFELRQAPFLNGWTWIHDLAQPDKLITFGRTVTLFWGLHFSGINVLPLLLAVMFYLQQKLTPKPPAQTPEQEQQQKMMLWMSVALFPLFLYNGPAGLNIYILTSTLIGVIESKIVRDHIKAMEAAGKDKVIVDTRPTRGSRRRDDERLPEAAQKRGRLSQWLANLQEMAEKARKKNDRGGR